MGADPVLTRIARVVARVATGSTYLLLGLDAARAPGPRVEMAASTLAALRKVVPLPVDDAQIVRANGAAQALAGAVLLTGRAQRWASLGMIASLIPTTLAGHDFWNIEDPMARKMQRTQFHKNLAMLGGLLFAVSDDTRTGAGR
jgi:putative oxidoreductase